MPELDLGNVKGPQGKSAYQSALDAGYSGSAEAFNAALSEVPGHIANSDIHVTAAQKTAWAGSVRYDAAQSLSDAQQAQARGNINAAPGGFGLGTISQTVTDFDTVKLNGWYYGATGTAHAPDSEHDWSVCVTNLTHNSEVCIQDAYAITNTNAYLHRRRLVYIDTATQDNPWEWVNPPMALGVEYRTTEKYLGKPVYVKVVDCGEITDGKEIDTGIPWALKVDVVSIQSYYSNPLPRVPFNTPSGSLNTLGAAFYVNAHIIKFVCGTAGAGGQARAIIRYTKTTD